MGEIDVRISLLFDNDLIVPEELFLEILLRHKKEIIQETEALISDQKEHR